MNIIITSTTKLVEIGPQERPVPARVWEGHTDSGIRVHCYITRIAVDAKDAEAVALFEKELQECAAPSAEVAHIPLRLII